MIFLEIPLKTLEDVRPLVESSPSARVLLDWLQGPNHSVEALAHQLNTLPPSA